MLKNIIVTTVLASAFLLVGCGETTANVSGEAFLKTNGGFVMTCAGNSVYLEKFSKDNFLISSASLAGYTKILAELKSALPYRADEEKEELEEEIKKLQEKIKNIPKDNVKETTCDSQGKFVFSGLKPDEYLIVTTVQWEIRGEKQGGKISKTITLKEGDNKVIITQQ